MRVVPAPMRVIPAKAGIQGSYTTPLRTYWIPAFTAGLRPPPAGMTQSLHLVPTIRVFHGTVRVLSGTGHVLSGTGHVLSGTGRVLSGTGRVLSGTGRVLSGTGWVLSGTGRVLRGTDRVFHRTARMRSSACPAFH